MARRRKSLHITRGADYFYRVDATLDGDPMELPDGALMVLERGNDQVEITPTRPTTGVWIFALTDDQTGELDEGLWEFRITTDDDIVIPWQTGHAIVDDRAGDGGDITQIVGVGDTTVEVIERTGIPIVVDGSGGTTADDITLVWHQTSPANPWVIDHPFSKVLAVTIVDSADETVEGDTNLNGTPGQVVVSFSGGFSGSAYVIGIP